MGADGMKMKESWTAWVEHLRDPDGQVNLLLAAAERLDRREGGGREALDRAKRDQIRAELYDDGYRHLGLKLVRGNYTTCNGFRWGYDAWNTHTVRAEGPFCPTNQTTAPAREGTVSAYPEEMLARSRRETPAWAMVSFWSSPTETGT